MGSYTVNMPKQAGWLVYINGLEVPVSSASISFGVWQMPTLSLTMVPHPILTRIGSEDRLQVVVFYLDHHWDPTSPSFRLLGEFEVIGWSYQNTPRARFISLSCISQLQIFEQLHFYYISSLDDIASAAGGEKATDPNIAQSVKVLYPASLFREGLTTPVVTKSSTTSEDITVDADAFIKRPIDFVTNIFRALLSVPSSNTEDVTRVDVNSNTVPQSAVSAPGKNFFARWLKMTGFHRRWAALPLLEDEGGDGCFPIVKATQDTNTLPALQSQIGQSIGNAGSAWQLLQQVLGYMYMEIGVIPAPAAAITVKGTGNITPPSGNIATVSSGAVASIPTFFVKPRCTFALPPSCNVIFPSMLSSYTFQENYINQPTRVYLGEQFISNVIAPPGKDPGISNLVQNLMVTGYPESVKRRMKDLLNTTPQTTNKNFLLFEEEFFKGPVSRRMNAPPWMYMLQQNMNAGQDAEGEKSESRKKLDADIQAATGEAIEGEITSGLGGLFDTYAKSEYYRSRYAERNGGVTLEWNPYIVPGFPVAVFDSRSSGFDTMSYANTVTHTLSAAGDGSMKTSVNLTFMRSMPEFIGLTAERDSIEGLDTAPAEVIPEVRDAFQIATHAHTLYRRLFYQDAPMKKSAVFDWKAMLDLVDSRFGNKLDPDRDAYRIDESIQLKPKEEFSGLFDNYDAAMRYASRPACTLQEYIETWHGRSLASLLGDRTVRGEYTSFYSKAHDAKGSKGAVFWGRIYNLQQGPGQPPGVTVSNMGPGPEYASAGDQRWETVDTSQMAQTRANWDKKLEEYRKIVRSESGRLAPQV